MWLITAIIFLPKVKEKIVTKFKKSKSFILACRVILPIVACMALVLETPYLFENVWISSNGMKVTLKDNKAIIRLEDGTELNGIYTQNYDNNNYTI